MVGPAAVTVFAGGTTVCSSDGAVSRLPPKPRPSSKSPIRPAAPADPPLGRGDGPGPGSGELPDSGENGCTVCASGMEAILMPLPGSFGMIILLSLAECTTVVRRTTIHRRGESDRTKRRMRHASPVLLPGTAGNGVESAGHTAAPLGWRRARAGGRRRARGGRRAAAGGAGDRRRARLLLAAQRAREPRILRRSARIRSPRGPAPGGGRAGDRRPAAARGRGRRAVLHGDAPAPLHRPGAARGSARAAAGRAHAQPGSGGRGPRAGDDQTPLRGGAADGADRDPPTRRSRRHLSPHWDPRGGNAARRDGAGGGGRSRRAATLPYTAGGPG